MGEVASKRLDDHERIKGSTPFHAALAHNLRLKQAGAGFERSAEHGKGFGAVRLGGMDLAKAPVRNLRAYIRLVREREPSRIDGQCTMTSSPGTSPEAWRLCT